MCHNNSLLLTDTSVRTVVILKVNAIHRVRFRKLYGFTSQNKYIHILQGTTESTMTRFRKTIENLSRFAFCSLTGYSRNHWTRQPIYMYIICMWLTMWLWARALHVPVQWLTMSQMVLKTNLSPCGIQTAWMLFPPVLSIRVTWRFTPIAIVAHRCQINNIPGIEFSLAIGNLGWRQSESKILLL